MVVRWSDHRIKETRDTICRLEPPYLIRQSDATFEDYEAICTEDFRCEYVDGVLIVHSPASFSHEDRIAFVGSLLRMFVSKHKLGHVLTSNAVMQIGENCLCPDVSFLSANHADRIKSERVHGPMDLVIEVLSKTTRSYDLGEKRACYREAQVPEIWLIDRAKGEFHVDWLETPAGGIQRTYQTLLLKHGRCQSRVLNGFWIDVEWLWAEPLPSSFECLSLILGST